MAEAAVKSAADWLGKLLIEEGKYLYGAEEKMEELRDELIWMQSFLRDADSIQYDDEVVGMWVRQIKEYVSIAEDIIDMFAIKVMSGRRRTGWMNKLKRYSCILCELKALHEVASSIDSLKLKISTLTPKLKTYGLKTAYGMKTYRSREALSKQAQERLNYLHLEDKDIVGLTEDTEKVVEALLKSEPKRRVVAIHGMGGSGKTTLAKKVYKHDKIVQYFSGGFAWAYISQQFQVRVVLQVLVSSLTSKPTELIAQKTEQELINEIREFLGKNRCLVVLDDVWNEGAWDSLKPAFPSYGISSGSIVLLTTRKDQVANYADDKALRLPKPLVDGHSWELLEKTLGGAIAEKFGSDGHAMIDLGKEMVKHCNGLPLAIVVLGGILRKKETFKEWQDVQEHINSYLRRGNDQGRSYMEVLLLSYNDLPYQLKPCFLHLGNFPEDHEIRTEKLYRMWVAEGLVTWPHDRVSGTESLEDVANDYLTGLAQAGMIEIMKKGSDSRIKSIRIHDLMRDVCLQKAAVENFLSTIDHRPCPDVPRISSSLNQKRLLRMAIYLAQDVNIYLPDSLISKTQKYLRSLLFFSGNEVEKGKARDWMKCICNDFPWLRVLDIEGCSLQGRLTRQVKNLMHLRYLSLKQTKVSELPSSIGNLRFLQILDLRVSSYSLLVKVPNVLWKLDQLRHLFLPKINYEIKRSKVLSLDTLSCLETLKNLEISKFRPQDLLKLGKLRKLSVKGVVSEEESLKTILQSPAVKSGNLQSCSLVINGNMLTRNPRLLSGYDCIHQLKIEDEILVRTEPVVFPRYLEVLHLESCKLENDPMSILGSLCILKDLFLGRDSFVGKEMTCHRGSFPQLTRLDLRWLVNLKVWKVEESSMSKLKRLTIMNCGQLQRIPDALAPSVHIICSPCISGVEKYGTCICYKPNLFGIADYKEEFIGLAEDTKRLVQSLVQDNYKKVVIYGTSGAGKAALAKILYHHPDIRMHFDATAWARYPQKATPSFPRHILQGLLGDLAPEESNDLSQKSSSDLIVELQNIMRQKKCLVVLTDLKNSNLTDFDVIFGFQGSEMRSKVLLTINEEPTVKSNEMIAHKLQFLSDEGSLALFQYRLESALIGNDGFIKAEMGKRMLKHCSGHPLSIIMLAGMLGMKETLIEWQTMEEEVTSRLENTQASEITSLIFAISYDDLPLHLRPCFLYLVNFPEDTEISTKKLYQMWISAGYVRLTEDAAQADEILEDVAETYMNELVQRGMVQVVKRGLTRRISTCRLHIMLQSLCLEKAKQENFFTVIGQVEPSASASNAWSTTHQMAVHLNQGENIQPAPTSSNERLISLLFFPNVSNPKHREGDWGWLVNICKLFQHLRVLDLEGMWMIKASLPAEVGNLTQLRYLSLKGTSVNELPLSIEKLVDLRTLDLRVVESLFIPDVLWKLQSLRHLYLPNLIDKSVILRLNGLEHLLTLVNLCTNKVQLTDMDQLKNLRRISIQQMQGKDDFEAIFKSQSTSLDLTINSEIITGDSAMLSSSNKLKKVRIKGRISDTLKLEPRMFPECLEELILKDTQLKDDPIPVLEKLPQLKKLCFDRNSFSGQKMTFSGGFPRLSHLTFRFLSNLEELDMAAAKRMRGLESLVIIDCLRLKKRETKLTAVKIRGGQQRPHPLLGLLRR